MKLIYLIFIPLFILTSCNPFHSNDVKIQAPQHSTAQRLSMPVIPVSISSIKEREIYLAKHYWENLDAKFVDDKLNKDELEQRFVDYLDLLTIIPAEQAKQDIVACMDKTISSPAIFRHFINLFEQYLFNPQSPLKNEEWYITVLEYVVHSHKVDELKKVKARYQLQMLYKNRLGNIATDFTYTSPAGERGNLHNFKSPLTLVLFYDPDCEHCQATIKELEDSQLLKDLQQTRELKILAVYPEANSKLWMDYASAMPANWVNVSDQQQITLHKKYDLQALPSIYLLDQDKRVLLKDASAANTITYLNTYKI